MANDPLAKGRGGNANFPNSRKDLELTEKVSRFLKETYVAYKQEKVHSDEELKQRLNDYFSYCGNENVLPTVEEMAMWTGYSISTVWDWENGRNKGFSPETSEIIKKAKDFLKTFDAKLVVAGKLNFLAYCFRAKNYYGMSDKREITILPTDPLGDKLDVAELRRRLLADTEDVTEIPQATIIDVDAE